VERSFQVDLHGLVDLLSNHLYSSPRVFVRELLQNAVDAITARKEFVPDVTGSIRIELVSGRRGDPATLSITDDGIGLTLKEAETFLATIGRSSKRDDVGALRQDFLGQFGIGLLACFVVAEEIVVISRSTTRDGPAVEWRGRPDGTYTVRELSGTVSPGTQVFLRSRPSAAEWFEPETVAELVRSFGGHLPVPITLSLDGAAEPITGPFPWERQYAASEVRDRELLAMGSEQFSAGMMDAFPLRSAAGGVEGIGFIAAASLSPVSRPAHRVYLKRMLLSDRLEVLLPDWAFFVRAMVNVTELRPTASREQLYDDERFQQTREELGRSIREWLVHLAADDPDRLRRIVEIHFLGLKALAVHDDEFLGLFADWLPVETSVGRMAIGELRRRTSAIRFSRSDAEFHQLAQVAGAQGLPIVNGGLVYDAELVERLPEVFPDVTVHAIDATDLIDGFSVLELDDQVSVTPFLRIADAVLQPLGCEPEIRRFEPVALPALLSTPASTMFRREIERTREATTDLWASIVDDFLSQQEARSEAAQLCFNHANPLIRRLIASTDREVVANGVGVLYVQALLLGRHPVSERELALMSSSIGRLLEWATDRVPRTDG
jgi:molecular chaperone HtpG